MKLRNSKLLNNGPPHAIRREEMGTADGDILPKALIECSTRVLRVAAPPDVSGTSGDTRGSEQTRTPCVLPRESSAEAYLLRPQPIRQGHRHTRPTRHDAPPQAQLEASPCRRCYRPRDAQVHPHPRRRTVTPSPREVAAAAAAIANGRVSFRGSETPHDVSNRPQHKTQQRDPVAGSPSIPQECLRTGCGCFG